MKRGRGQLASPTCRVPGLPGSQDPGLSSTPQSCPAAQSGGRSGSHCIAEDSRGDAGPHRPHGEVTWAFLPLCWDLPEQLKQDLTQNQRAKPLSAEDSGQGRAGAEVQLQQGGEATHLGPI